MKHVKYHDENLRNIQDGRVSATWRVHGEYERPEPGEVFAACDTDGNVVCYLRCISVKETLIDYITEDDMRGHKKYASKMEVLESMRKYYEMDIDFTTKIDIVRFVPVADP